MERIELRTESRTILGKQVKQLRAEGWIPAVLFGADEPSQAIQVEERVLIKALNHAGTTSLINLFVDDESKPRVVLAREIQRDILTGKLHHVDFFRVQLDQKIKTTPALEIVGQSPVIDSGRGILVQILNQVEVECLPSDLIDSIAVDISSLETLEDSITIGDLTVPPGVTILADPSDTVASVVPPRVEREEEEEEELLFEEVEAEEGVVEVEEED
jgi:large subunit ribosomal protein L25